MGSVPTVPSLQGDSRGPLVCGGQVVGVFSFTSTDPTDPLKPPVASSAVKHKKWMQKTLPRGMGEMDQPILFTQVSF